MDIGRSGDKDTTNAERRKRAGLHEDYEKLSPIMKFGANNWFRLVVISFLVIFTYQLNEIKNKRQYTNYVTIDNFMGDAMDDLRRIRSGD